MSQLKAYIVLIFSKSNNIILPDSSEIHTNYDPSVEVMEHFPGFIEIIGQF